MCDPSKQVSPHIHMCACCLQLSGNLLGVVANLLVADEEQIRNSQEVSNSSARYECILSLERL